MTTTEVQYVQTAVPLDVWLHGNGRPVSEALLLEKACRITHTDKNETVRVDRPPEEPGQFYVGSWRDGMEQRVRLVLWPAPVFDWWNDEEYA